MKKLITYSLMFVVTAGCFDDTATGPSLNNNSVYLGNPSMVMDVVSTSGIITSSTYTITMDVTPGAMYSLQLTHINENIVHNYPFTAQAGRVTVTLNYSSVPNGAYDLYLMNTSGQELKVPVIIKH